jgi:hypothetical protein
MASVFQILFPGGLFPLSFVGRGNALEKNFRNPCRVAAVSGEPSIERNTCPTLWPGDKIANPNHFHIEGVFP